MTPPSTSFASTPLVVPPAEAEHAARGHFVHFYDRDEALAEALGRFIGDALASPDGVGVVVGTPERRDALVPLLEGRGIDVQARMREGRFVLLDAASLLGEFMREDWPDAIRFDAIVGAAIRRAGGDAVRPIRVFGEMVALLWAEQKREAAVRLETLWNDLSRRHAFSLFCAYPASAFHDEADVRALVDLCVAHRHAIPTETYAGLATVEERLRLIIELQRQALTAEIDAYKSDALEQTLARREAELRKLTEDADQAVIDLCPEGQILWTSPDWVRYVGRDVPAVGLRASDFFPETGLVDALWSDLVAGRSSGDLLATLRVDGAVGRPEERRVRIQARLRLLSGTLGMRWFVRDALVA